MKHLAAAAALLSLAACSAPPPAERSAAAVPNAITLPPSQSWRALSTPEGAAEELFRAYIELDAERFRRACARPFGDPRTRAHYERFVEGAAAEIRKAAGGGLPPQGAPVDLIAVHPAQELPSTFRTAAAYDHMSQRSAVLVEVDAYLAGRGVETSRVIVLRDSAGQWGAAPRPELFGFNLR